MLFLKGATRPAAHIDEVLVVHLHNVVQQRLSRLSQKTGDKRIALRWRESFQRLRVVSLGQLRQVVHHARVNVPECDSIGDDLLDQSISLDVLNDRWSRGVGWILFESKQS